MFPVNSMQASAPLCAKVRMDLEDSSVNTHMIRRRYFALIYGYNRPFSWY
jgi:hypothetical protein